MMSLCLVRKEFAESSCLSHVYYLTRIPQFLEKQLETASTRPTVSTGGGFPS